MDGAPPKQDGLWDDKSSNDISSCPEASLETLGSLALPPDQPNEVQNASIEVKNRIFREGGSPDRSSQEALCQNGQFPDPPLSLDPTASPVGPDASAGVDGFHDNLRKSQGTSAEGSVRKEALQSLRLSLPMQETQLCSTASSLPLEKEEQVRLQARKRLEEQLMQYRVKRHRERSSQPATKMKLFSTLDPELMLNPENLPRASTVAVTKEYSFLRTSVPRGPKVGSLGLLAHSKEKKSSKSSKIRSLADYRTEESSDSGGLGSTVDAVGGSLKQSRSSTSVVSEVSPSSETDNRVESASLAGDSVSEADGNESDSSSHSSFSARGPCGVVANVGMPGAAYMVDGQEISAEALGQFPSIKDVLQSAAAQHQDQNQEVNGEVQSRRDSICSSVSMESSLAETQDEMLQVLKEKMRLEGQLEALSLEATQALQEKAELQAQLAALSTRLQAQVEHSHSSQQKQDSLSSEVDTLKQSCWDLERAMTDLQNMLEAKNASLASSNNDLQMAEEQYQRLMAKVEDMQRNILSKDNTVHDLRQQMAALQSQLHQVQLERTTLTSKLQASQAEQRGCARLEETCLSKAGEDFTRVCLQLPGKKFPSGGSSRSSSGGGGGGSGGGSSSDGGSPTSCSGEQGRMPVLERYFHSAELGRRWTAPEGVLPSALGSRPGCQQGPLPWDLPEMIRMVKLVWKSKSELQATKPRGILENEDALHSFPGDVRLRGQTGVPAERRGSYPFIDFRLLNNTTHSGEIGTKKKVKRLLSFQRYFHASRLLRGIIPQAPLHLLDEDYLGQARHMLSKVGMWDFDIFLFDRLTNGNSLVTLLCHLFNTHGLIHHFKLDMVTLHRFLVMVQEDYHGHNPYHNAVHAADVTQAMHCYLKEPKLASFLTPLDIMLGLLAAAAHDVDHPGVNQPFLIKTNHHLANLYQNMSVLENHHWRSTIGMLRESRLLAHLPKEMTQDIEQQLGSLILATDINRQNEFLTRLKAHLHNKDLRLENVQDRHFMLQIALKCADICNPCRIWEMSKQWSERVCEEFYRQGDLEQKFELEISPLCNQQKDSIPSIQIGFMTYIVEPLFREWARFTGNSTLSENMLSHLAHNKAQWKSLLSKQHRRRGSGQDSAAPTSETLEQTEGATP